jgi:phosphoglucosamine mutase
VAFHVGYAFARLFGKADGQARFLIGQDTRISGDMLAHALVSGICAAGARAELIGVLPTPGIAYLVRSSGAQGGVVISASHNPYQDNGIKLFSAEGRKLSDQTEAEIEKEVHAGLGTPPEAWREECEPERVVRVDDAGRRYAEFLASCVQRASAAFSGLKVVLDCAHGATYAVAPGLFASLGTEVEALHMAPNGRNINLDCGSQHPRLLVQRVLGSKAAIGLAFDGDGDRLAAVDETGGVLTGDEVLAVCAAHFRAKGTLANGTVVSTIDSNTGLRESLERMGLRHVATDVGDRHVAQAMLAEGAVLGGEKSGHMIFAAHHTTGDGMLSGLKLIEAIAESRQPLSELKRIMTLYPEEKANVAVARMPPIDAVEAIAVAIAEVRKHLDGRGKVLVRYSGTEPLCRVSVEAPTAEIARDGCRRIAAAVKAALG